MELDTSMYTPLMHAIKNRSREQNTDGLTNLEAVGWRTIARSFREIAVVFRGAYPCWSIPQPAPWQYLVGPTGRRRRRRSNDEYRMPAGTRYFRDGLHGPRKEAPL